MIEPLVTFVDLIGGFQPDMAPSAFVVRPALGVRLPLGFFVFAGYSYAALWNGVLERTEKHNAFHQVGYLAPPRCAAPLRACPWGRAVSPGQ